MSARWEVVGGADKGGILAREGVGLKTPELSSRLGTGSVVEELELAGDRLHYRLAEGSGPVEGWISLKVSGRELVRPISVCAVAPEKCSGLADQSLWHIKPDSIIPPAVPPPPVPQRIAQLMPLPPWYKPAAAKGEKTGDIITKVAKGELYGLEFPFTVKMLKEMGPAWLTKAFHAAGSLPRTNHVTKIASCVELPMSGYDAAGGAGMKGLITVEYAQPDPDLHTDLFVKVPFAEEDNMTWRMNMSFFGDPDGAEVSVYTFLAYLLPFRIPKPYYADIARATTNYLIVTEKINFAPKKKKCSPYEIHPACGKYQDYDLVDPVQPYYALMRAMARMAAWDHQGRFDRVKQIFEESTYARFGGRSKVLADRETQAAAVSAATPAQMEAHRRETYKAMIAQAAKKLKTFTRHWENCRRFMTELAPWMFPEDCKEQKFLDGLKPQLELLFKIGTVISTYCTEGPKSKNMFGLIHPNLQVDNAFFWTDEEGRYHAGLFDWGGCGYQPYAGVFLACVSGALPEVYLEHEERWFRCFADEYKRFGGGELDADELVRQSRLMFSMSMVGIVTNVSVQAMNLTTEEEWKTITNKFDERVMGRWNVRCQACAAECAMPVWRRGPHWQYVLDLCKELDIDPAKI